MGGTASSTTTDIYMQVNTRTASSTTSDIYMQVNACTAISTILHPPKDWEQLLDDVDSTLTRAYLEKCLRRTNIFYQNNKFSVEEERNGKLALLDILLK